ncbi:MAG: hypothetical protein WAK91_07615 [Candidatus Acidiferrales bacterium]|jgi:hypothetical protein
MFAPTENPELSWSPLKFIAAFLMAGAGGMLFLSPHHKLADAVLIFAMLLLIVDIFRKREKSRSTR